VAGAPSSTISTSLVKWPALITEDFPFLFVGSSSPEQWTDERLSYYNTGEVNEVKNIVTGLLGVVGAEPKYLFPTTAYIDPKTSLKAPEISIISPFREQVWRIRVALRTMGLGAVDVGDVESLQGGEKSVSCLFFNELLFDLRVRGFRFFFFWQPSGDHFDRSFVETIFTGRPALE
jgi:AAA domain